MAVVVVGATGVLGRALVPLLRARGHRVRALARSSARARDLLRDDVEVHECDLLAPDAESSLPGLLSPGDSVVHIAAAIAPDPRWRKHWEAAAALRTVGVGRLLRAALGAGAARYVQQSIVMAYPDHGDRWIEEDAPLDRSRARAAVCAPVIAMESMVRSLAGERLRWCILRGGAFVGPETAQEVLVHRLRARELVVPGNGAHFISPIHVADMAGAVLAALERDYSSCVLNIVDEPVRYGEYVDRIARSLDAAPPPRDASRSPPPSLRCHNRAARSVLGWAPERQIYPAQ